MENGVIDSSAAHTRRTNRASAGDPDAVDRDALRRGPSGGVIAVRVVEAKRLVDDGVVELNGGEVAVGEFGWDGSAE